MKDGKISEIGTYDELLDSRGAFAEFLMEQMQQVTNFIIDVNLLSDVSDPQRRTLLISNPLISDTNNSHFAFILI